MLKRKLALFLQTQIAQNNIFLPQISLIPLEKLPQKGTKNTKKEPLDDSSYQK